MARASAGLYATLTHFDLLQGLPCKRHMGSPHPININKFERVQRRATRLLRNIKRLHYQDRLKILNLPSLVYRRIRGDMIEAYKFCHDLYAVDCGILQMADGSITRGHNYKLLRSTCSSRIRHDYFSQRIVEHWNRLPSDVVNALSVNSFKGRLDRHWKEFSFLCNYLQELSLLVTDVQIGKRPSGLSSRKRW